MMIIMRLYSVNYYDTLCQIILITSSNNLPSVNEPDLTIFYSNEIIFLINYSKFASFKHLKFNSALTSNELKKVTCNLKSINLSNLSHPLYRLS